MFKECMLIIQRKTSRYLLLLVCICILCILIYNSGHQPVQVDKHAAGHTNVQSGYTNEEDVPTPHPEISKGPAGSLSLYGATFRSGEEIEDILPTVKHHQRHYHDSTGLQEENPDPPPNPYAKLRRRKVSAERERPRDVKPRGPLLDDVTVVTGYINIGAFRKGDENTQFTPELYRKWMRIFGQIKNPVIAYMDNDDDAVVFRNIRTKGNLMNRTYIVSVERHNLWAFSLWHQIDKIFSKHRYPKFYPNTVNSKYVCAMHAKYEFMLKAVQENYFNTKYFSWLDIGLFRDITGVSNEPIHLYLPEYFDFNKVAYSRVYPRNLLLSTQDIIYGNMVWVCGCFFIGEGTAMQQWAYQYMDHVQYILDQSLMSTDQQVLYSLFNHGNVGLKLQEYYCNVDDTSCDHYSAWFYLGYLCKEAGEKHFKLDKNGAVQRKPWLPIFS